MSIRNAAVTILIAVLSAAPLMAQEPPTVIGQPGARKLPPPIPLKVTVLLSRYQGEKRISSMPYVLGVMASGWGAGPKTTLRMGLEVPVATSSNVAVSPVSYRNVGTNIDCGATFDEATPGSFQLALVVSDSSLGLNAGDKRDGLAPDMPSFRNFNSSFTALLRDGQTMQYTSA